MEHVLTEGCGEATGRNWQAGNPALHQMNAHCEPGTTYRLACNREHGRGYIHSGETRERLGAGTSNNDVAGTAA